MRRVLTLILTALAMPFVAFAQLQYGTIRGLVTDTTGSVIVGAAVKATNQETGTGFSTISNESGQYIVGGLLPGLYSVTAEMRGFKRFTQTDVTNLVDVGRLIGFMTQMLLVFGLAFEIPLFVVMLNLAGVVSGQQIGRARPWIVIGTMVFAAVATPSTDPFSMLMLGVPMLILFGLSEIIARILDRIRGKGAHSPNRTDQWADDQASPL